MRLSLGYAILSVYVAVTFARLDGGLPSYKHRGHSPSRRSFFQDLKLTLAELVERNSLRLARSLQTQHDKRNTPMVQGSRKCVARPQKLGQPTSPADQDGKAGGSSSTVRSSTSTRSGTIASSSTSSASTKTSPAPTSTSTSGSNWKNVFEASGNDFFDEWTFWSDADPTNGAVDYLTLDEAKSNDLISINSDGHAIMRVETTPQVTGLRKSVRIHSINSFNGGLWVLDAVHMPVGCGSWPAFWTHGPNWPNSGEIDILEGVNENSFNQMSLHTATGCTLAPDFGATGVVATGSNCAAAETANQGCGIRSVEANSYGAGFNSNGGGVYAMMWDESGIQVFFFPRGSIPKDISSGSPQPSGWGKPSARWPASTCAPFQFNKDHMTIFDTTFCGDWAGASWAVEPNGGGQSCAAKTGVATCQEYVQNNGAAFADAYWQVKSVKIYQQ